MVYKWEIQENLLIGDKCQFVWLRIQKRWRVRYYGFMLFTIANGHIKPLLHYAFLACVFDENARDFVLGILRKYFLNQ